MGPPTLYLIDLLWKYLLKDSVDGAWLTVHVGRSRFGDNFQALPRITCTVRTVSTFIYIPDYIYTCSYSTIPEKIKSAP